MAQTIKVLVNTGNEKTNKTFDVVQGKGGKPTTIKAVEGARYHLEDPAAKNVGPENIRSKRVGKNIHVMLEGSNEADLIIEGYYNEDMLTESNSGLYGRAEDGNLYEYIAEDSTIEGNTINLVDGGQPVSQVLGGAQIGEAFELSGLAAASAFNPVYVAAVGGGAAAAGGGGGGGSGGGGTTDTSTYGFGGLTHNAANDTGSSSSDNITANKRPTFSGTGEPEATVNVTVDGQSVTAVVDADGNWTTSALGSDLSNGRKTVTIVFKDKAGNTATVISTFVIDDASDSNPNNDPSSDDNAHIALDITNISDDTGGSNTDFITGDNALNISGTAVGYSNTGGATGDRLRVQIFNAAQPTVLVKEEFVTVDANGNWTLDNESAPLIDGTYILKATILDAAGNVVNASADKTLVVDTSTSNDPNAAISIALDGIDDGSTNTTAATGSKDSGVSPMDFVTNDQSLTFTGTVGAGFDATAGQVHLQVFKTGVAIAVVDQYVTPDSSGSWSFNNQANTLDSGRYTIKADIVDNAGNVIKSATSQELVIDNSGGSNPDNSPDPNASATVAITGISDDTGTLGDDFITTDPSLTYSGTVVGFTNNGDQIKLQLFDSNGTVIGTAQYVVPVLNGAAPSTGTWSWPGPNIRATGNYTLRATLVDVAGNPVNNVSGQDTKSVTIVAVNDAPINNGLTDLIIDEDASAVAITGLSVSDARNNGDSYTVTLEVSEGVLTVSGGTATIIDSGTSRVTLTGTKSAINATLAATVSYIPTSNFNGAVQLTMSTNDGSLADAKADFDSITITVNAVNDAPAGEDKTLTVLEDGSKTFGTADFGFSDVDGNSLSAVIITTLPVAGTLKLNGANVTLNQSITAADIAAGKLVFAPALNGNSAGYASIGFKVQDNGGTANAGVDTSVAAKTLTMDVTAVNDAPAASPASIANAFAAATAPEVTITDNQSATTVAINTDVTYTLTFSEAVKAGTLTEADFSVQNGTLKAGSLTQLNSTTWTVVATTSAVSGSKNMALVLADNSYQSFSNENGKGGTGIQAYGVAGLTNRYTQAFENTDTPNFFSWNSGGTITNANPLDADNEYQLYSGANTGGRYIFEKTKILSGQKVTTTTGTFEFMQSTTLGDGFSYNFGLATSINSASFEHGYGVGLTVKFLHFDSADPIVINWNGVQLAFVDGKTPYGQIHFAKVQVSDTGVVTVLINNVVALTATIPNSEWQSTDMTNWTYGVAGRTGANAGSAWIDNLAITQGTPTTATGADTLVGNDASEYIDIATGATSNATGADTVLAGAGDDTVVFNSFNLSAMNVDGGAGVNLLQVNPSSAGMTIDLTSSAVLDRISNFSSINLSGTNADNLKLDWQAISTLSGATDNALTGLDESKMLVVSGDAGDVVQLVGKGNWSVGTSQTAANLSSIYGSAYNFLSGHTYKQYTLLGATLFIDDLIIKTDLPSTNPVFTNAMTVQALFGPSFTDVDAGNTFKGVAIISAGSTSASNPLDPIVSAATLKYQYSLNGGTTWVDLAKDMTANAAVFLEPTALIRFIDSSTAPIGYPSMLLQARLVDTSGATGTAGLVSGNTVNASTFGGATAFSSNIAVVQRVNRAPVSVDADGIVTSNPFGALASGATPGIAVDTLFAQHYSDVDGNYFQGVMITSAGTSAQQSSLGKYQYSKDGGTTWVDLPSTTSDTSAVYLLKTHMLRFVATAGNTDAIKPDLTVRFVEYSSVTSDWADPQAATSTLYNVSGANSGGATAVSGNTITLRTPLAVGITAASADVAVVEEFEGLTLGTKVTQVNTNYVTLDYFSNGAATTLELMPWNVGTLASTADQKLLIGMSNLQASAANFSLVVTPKLGKFSAFSFEFTDVQLALGMVEILDASGVVIATQALQAVMNTTGTFSWSSATLQGSSFRVVNITGDRWEIDTLSFTPVLTSGSSTTDTTPTLTGVLSTALQAGESVHIFEGSTDLGVAVVTGTTWSFTIPAGSPASLATHNYTAKLMNGATVLTTSSAFTLNVVATPLVFDLNGDGVQTTNINEGTQFDLLATGTKQNVGWVSKQDGLLAMDLNGDGQINSGAELFGDHTRLADGSLAKDGWAALAALDSHHDGQIDAQDAQFNQLRVWVDANSNGTTDAGELRTLAEAHIASIHLSADNNAVQQNGNVVQAFSTYTSTDGTTHEVADVGLQSKAVTPSPVLTLENGLSLDLAKLTTVASLTEVDMVTDTAANTVKLTLADVLGTATTQGVHKLTLTGGTNDAVSLDLTEWANSGTTVAQGGHTYAVFNATATNAAQLLIDQTMLTAQHVG